MIEALGMLGAVAFAGIPAGFIGRAIYKKLRQRARETRWKMAKQEQAEIAALYNEMLNKGVLR